MGILTLLMSVVGPVAGQFIKSRVTNMPRWARVATQAGIQIGGAIIATKIGVNPFEGVPLEDVGMFGPAIDAAVLAATNYSLGNVAYEGWRARANPTKPTTYGRAR